MPQTPIALIDCNAFYASCEQVFAPDATDAVVASNNDGCVIALSKGARRHVKMGVPLFQNEELFEKHNIHVFSANFAMYADFSNRVMATLRECVPAVYWYSIDESFATFPVELDPGKVQSHIKMCTGISTSIGIGETKTLAKIANHVAKKNQDYGGTFVLPHGTARDTLFETLDVGEVWGIGRRWKKRLNELDITNVRQLRDANPKWICKHFSVVLERTVRELNGLSCIPLEEAVAENRHRCCSRSFGTPITRLEDLEESIAYFATRVTERMRREGLIGQYVQAFLTTKDNTDDPHYANGHTVALPEPTNYTPTIARYATLALRKIYKPGYLYRRAGINILGLTKTANRQRDLFAATNPEKEKALMKVLDNINGRFGRDTLRLASEGTGDQVWKMRQVKRSPRYTTRWSEIPVAV